MDGLAASIHIGLVPDRAADPGGKRNDRTLHVGTEMGAKIESLGILISLFFVLSSRVAFPGTEIIVN